MLNLIGDTQMKGAKEISLPNDVTKVRFQQTYKGIPVFGHSVAASRSDMGALTNLQGQILDLDNQMVMTQERVSADEAMSALLGNDLDCAMNK
jgi:vibriolysin